MPNEYDARDALPAAAAFLDAQRSGDPAAPGGAAMPAAARLLYGVGGGGDGGGGGFGLDQLSAFRADPVPGGFFMGADYVKHSLPLATSVAALSWSLLTFGPGYAAAGSRGRALAARHGAAKGEGVPWAASAASTARGVVKHAARYLIGCHPSEFEFVARIGDPSDYVIEALRAGPSGEGPGAGTPAGPSSGLPVSLLAASGSGGGGEPLAFNASTRVVSARGFWGMPLDAPSAAANRTASRLTLASSGGAEVLAAASAALASASLALRLPRLRDDPAADRASRDAPGSSSLGPDEDAPDDALAAEALRHARQLYTFALALQTATRSRPPPPGTPAGAAPTYCAALDCFEGRPPSEGGGYRYLAFPSSSASDDLAWAAAWLHKATGGGVRGYLEDARAHLARHAASAEARPLDPAYYAPNYDNAVFSAAVLLGAEDLGAPPADAERYRAAVSSFARAWLTGRSAAGQDLVRQTPRGLAYLPAPDGAPLPNALAAAHLAMQAAAAVRRQQGAAAAAPGSAEARGALASLPPQAAANLECFARRQVHYALGGSLGQGRSFVVGIGSRAPERPMHRQASCPLGGPEDGGRRPACGVGPGLLTSAPNAVTLTGAVVAGPDAEDGYADDRTEPASAVGFHLQAPFVGALAALSAPGPAREARCASDAAAGGFATLAAAAEAGPGAVPPDPLAVSMI